MEEKPTDATAQHYTRTSLFQNNSYKTTPKLHEKFYFSLWLMHKIVYIFHEVNTGMFHTDLHIQLHIYKGILQKKFNN